LKTLFAIKSSLSDNIFADTLNVTSSHAFALTLSAISVTIGMSLLSTHFGLRKITGHCQISSSDLFHSSSLSIILTQKAYSHASLDIPKVTELIVQGVILTSKILLGLSVL
jgi:hypothetical protein